MINVEKTGANAYEVCVNHFGSVKNASKNLNLSVQAIYNWKETTKMPSIDSLATISDLTGILIDDLVVRE